MAPQTVKHRKNLLDARAIRAGNLVTGRFAAWLQDVVLGSKPFMCRIEAL